MTFDLLQKNLSISSLNFFGKLVVERILKTNERIVFNAALVVPITTTGSNYDGLVKFVKLLVVVFYLLDYLCKTAVATS